MQQTLSQQQQQQKWETQAHSESIISETLEKKWEPNEYGQNSFIQVK